MQSTANKIGVLGLGIIGSIWARHWQKDGQLAAAWNRTPQPDFPHWVNQPHEAAHAADFLLVCVADPAAVASVLDQLLPALEARHLVIQSSTIDPASSAAFAAKVTATGARYLEAPFTGSKPAAEARQSVFYLGGSSETVTTAEPLLSHVSQKRYHIGTCEQAATLKLAMNLQLALQAEALCESLAFARRAGISDETFFDCLRCNAAWSGLSALKEPKLRARDYAPQFSVKHMHKDMRLALQSGGSEQLPAVAIIEQQLRQAAENGHAEADFIALIQNLSTE